MAKRRNGNGDGSIVQSIPPGVAPVPSRVQYELNPDNFFGMWPQRFFPDHWVNLRSGGVTYWITTESNYPIDLTAAGTAGSRVSVTLNTGDKYDDFVVVATAQMSRIAGESPDPADGIETYFYGLDVQRWDQASGMQIDAGFVALTSVFGDGRYPHYNAIPMVLPRNTELLLEIRNQEAFGIRLFLNFMAIRKNAGLR